MIVMVNKVDIIWIMVEEFYMKLWIVDYINPHDESSDCLVIEAECRDSAYELAVEELKLLDIPKRYLLKMEEF